MKIHSHYANHILTQSCQVVGRLAGNVPELVIDSDETRKSKEYKSFNPINKFPLLETPEGNISESTVIAKFLAAGHATLLGSNEVERAQVDQWLMWSQAGDFQSTYPAIMSIFGHTEITQAAFNDATKLIKANVMAMNNSLTGDWLVGNSVTVADVFLAGFLGICYQTILDLGFKKAAPKAAAWFERVTALPEFVAVFGRVKIAKKSIKPQIKTEEKPKKAAQAQAAKPKKDEAAADQPKKDVNPLDALPPTSFDLFNFKTYYVNAPDKGGEGWAEFMKQVDLEGYAFWFLHYEKFGKEGTVDYQFQNLLEGFLQRMDHFRKHAFGKFCMLNEVPDLEIQGVLLVRGQVIPQELIDHPQFEYMQPRKMDMKDEKDNKIACDFFASTTGGTCNGMPVQISSWHK